MTPNHLAETYRSVRDRTVALAAPLTAEDCAVQSMPDASPTKWHLGHTTWFFETFVLERMESGFMPFTAAFRVLFNSYYNTIGDKHPRPQRGLLTRPGLDVVLAYRAQVDRRMLALISQRRDAELQALVELGLHHEQQHQELLLTDIKHLFSLNPLSPAYSEPAPRKDAAAPLQWLDFAGGLIDIGHTGTGFCYDNERPQHQVFLQPYRLASRLVTNEEYARFITAGGYADPGYWLAEGWDWRGARGLDHPLYWRRMESGWGEFTLGGEVALDGQRPVVHVSYFEADAFARWSGARLPTEAEWEHAAVSSAGGSGSTAEHAGIHAHTTQEQELAQLFAHAWQWTSSSYAPYPGFHPGPGAVGEYNGKFMVNQYVLRGSSCATPIGHARTSYRNFFPASACWQFSGIRLAQDA